MKARDYFPAVKFGAKWYPEDIVGTPFMNDTNNYWFVDGDKSASGSGTSWEDAFHDVESAVNNTSLTAGDTIFVAARTMNATSTDPVSYTENAVIDTPSISLIGVSRGRTQGGLPQLKVGSTTTSPIISVKAPGVLIANIGINGVGATGGGIKYFDDGGTTYASFGGSVVNCHFKNCVGTTATDSRTGGAIQLSGAPWQMYFGGNHFYKNVGDIVLLDTSNAVPQDVVIQENTFLAASTSATDCNIYMAGGSGCSSLIIDRNIFTALPALGSGSVLRFMDLTSCYGTVTNNTFGCYINATATELTFGAAGTAAKCPATVWLCNNWGKSNTVGETAEVIQIA